MSHRVGLGPTIDMLPNKTLKNCGNSSSDVLLKNRPTLVTRTSPRTACVTTLPFSCTTIVLNFHTCIDFPSIPYRVCRNKIGPFGGIFYYACNDYQYRDINIKIIKERTISSSLFKTLFMPFRGVSNNGTTGTPLTSSVRD